VISEWGNPTRVMACELFPEYIGTKRQTEGSETSQYLQEKKSTEIPPVAASERGTGQTQRHVFGGCRAPIYDSSVVSRTSLESLATEGDSPVGENERDRGSS
jgi:hypothetical protein